MVFANAADKIHRRIPASHNKSFTWITFLDTIKETNPRAKEKGPS